MSLSLRDELRVFLHPGQVALARIGREITGRGIVRRMLGKQVVSCDDASAAEIPWGGAVKALESALPGMAGRKQLATVILSSHFVRHALVPWSAELNSDEEEMAFARHSFRKIYGDVAERWELRLSPDKAGLPQLASAVDSRLPDALRALFNRAGVALGSIQPHLMAACNSSRNRLNGRSTWLALVEPGALCLSLLQQGSWAGVRTMRIRSGWRDELPLILEREAYLADSGMPAAEVLVWAPEPAEAVFPEHVHWMAFHRPDAAAQSVPEPETAVQYAMARG